MLIQNCLKNVNNEQFGHTMKINIYGISQQKIIILFKIESINY